MTLVGRELKQTEFARLNLKAELKEPANVVNANVKLVRVLWVSRFQESLKNGEALSRSFNTRLTGE